MIVAAAAVVVQPLHHLLHLRGQDHRRAEAVAAFMDWQELALVENLDQFKADLVVERNSRDVNRMDMLMPPDLVNQLRFWPTLIQFRL